MRDEWGSKIVAIVEVYFQFRKVYGNGYNFFKGKKFLVPDQYLIFLIKTQVYSIFSLPNL